MRIVTREVVPGFRGPTGLSRSRMLNKENLNMWSKLLCRASAAAWAALIWSSPAGAATITYEATSAGGNAPASATFTTSGNTVTISMVNNDVNPNSVGENVSALIFQVSNG